MSVRILAALAAAAALAACATNDAPAPAAAATCADFGCASEANLRAMAADPADLEHGAELAPARGDAAVAAVTRHRTGETKPLPDGLASYAPD